MEVVSPSVRSRRHGWRANSHLWIRRPLSSKRLNRPHSTVSRTTCWCCATVPARCKPSLRSLRNNALHYQEGRETDNVHESGEEARRFIAESLNRLGNHDL